MTLTDILKRVEKTTRDNSPAIYTALGVSGAITTAYLVGKASFKASRAIDIEEAKTGTAGERTQRVKERTKLVWKYYIPAGVSLTVTVSSIVLASRVSARRTAAVTAAYSISERAFHEYREKVAETIGEKKAQALNDQIAQDRVTNNPPNNEIVVVGSGNVLCHELYTGRYFNSDMETLRRCENELNARILREMYASLSDFYCLVGLPYTANSNDIGWDSDRLVQLKFSTVLSDDGRPCIAFDYNYTKPLYTNGHQ